MLLKNSSGANKVKQNTHDYFSAHNFVDQEFWKGSAEHFLLGVLMQVESECSAGLRWTAKLAHLHGWHLVPTVGWWLCRSLCMKYLLPTWQNQGSWAFYVVAGLPQNECRKRNRQKLHGIFLPGLGNHKISLLLPSTGDERCTKSNPD